MTKEKNSISKLLLKNHRVNNYTKLLIILSQLDFYNDYYIPNAKLEKMLNIKRNKIREILHQLEKDKIIALFYRGRKRYFTFIAYSKEEKKEVVFDYDTKEVFDYNWLEEDF